MRSVRHIGPLFLGCSSDRAVGRAGVVQVQGFPSLEELKFRNMPEWEQWEVPLGDDLGQPLFLPRLRKLEILKCPKLRELPPLPPTLTRLAIRGVGMVRLPGWFRSRGGGDGGNFDEAPSSLYSLSYLCIEDCPNLRSLDGGLLQSPLRVLEVLKIDTCGELESLPERGLGHLTSLKSFRMASCPKLARPSSSVVREEAPLPRSLEQVSIYGCSDTVAELLPVASLQKLSSLRRLHVDSVGSVAGFRERTSLTSLGIHNGSHLDSEALSMGLQVLTSLQYLAISDCPLLTTLPCEEVLRRLPALQELRIWSCEQLTSLGGIHALVSLKDLAIKNCPKLLHLVVEAATSPPPSSPPRSSLLVRLETLSVRSSSPQQITMWLRQCPSLRVLQITSCPLLTCFGDGSGDDVGRVSEAALLNVAPSLRTLTFYSCENLRSLPSMLRCLSSLDDLRIANCPMIQRLPATGLPESLESLVIDKCPALGEQCRVVGSPDSALISHVPLVRVRE